MPNVACWEWRAVVWRIWLQIMGAFLIVAGEVSLEAAAVVEFSTPPRGNRRRDSPPSFLPFG